MNNLDNKVIPKKRGRKPKIINNTNNELGSDIKNNIIVKSVASQNNSDYNSDSDNVLNSIDTIKKKRGRKPKIKSESEEKVEIVKKKRGRKPKIKNPEEENQPKILKKRGRKPKQPIINTIDNNLIFNKETENIIVHLPIKTDISDSESNNDSNINQKKSITDEFEYNPEIYLPKPYEDSIMGKSVDNCLFISQQGNNNDNELCGKGQDPSSQYVSYPFDEKHKDIIDILEDNVSLHNDKEIEITNNNKQIEDKFNVNHDKDWYSNKQDSLSVKQVEVDQIMKDIKTQRKIEIENIKIKSSKNTVEKCLVQMEQCNKDLSWPSSTSIHCWWCCHSFNGPPCCLPCNFVNNTFHVIGIFCSPECAAAYNFNDTNLGYDLWERYSLLNFLYRKIYTINNIKIKLAPPKECLKIFGGNLSINEFRINNTNYNNTYKIVMPPMISIIPTQEISEIDSGYSSTNKIYLIEKEKIDNNELKLKRSKPFNSQKNTLQKCMKIVS